MYEANAKTEMNLDGIDSVISYFKEIPESSLIGEIPNLPDEMLKLAEQIRYDFSGLLEQAKPLEQVA
ncbi:MAG: hypothetical protein LBF15_06965 [Candidatus Peribacteria bacterium]|jgi:hypothetical protein|nr:hypothetical protein [Candidatus Peribacteria bacterium]